MSYLISDGNILRTGVEVFRHHQSTRSDLAAQIMEMRRHIRSIAPELNANTMVSLRFSNELRRAPFNPTANNFRRAASDKLAYSKEIISPCGNEYYSACGMEDYYGERKEYARCVAVEYFRAWKFMTGK